MRTAIDSDVLSALWSGESTARIVASLLGKARAEGGLVICGPVYAELRAHPNATEEFVNTFLTRTGIDADFDLSEAAWREAGRAYAEYAIRRRKSRDAAKRLLTDFVIGAHASLNADRLLTLDPARYRTAFPKLRLIPASA